MKYRIMKKNKKNIYPYLLILPAALFMLIFLFYPLLNVFYLSFRNYDFSRPYLNGFAGLKNFQTLFSEPLFYEALKNSAKWVFSEVGLQLVLGMMVALILHCKFAGRGIARVLLFIPWALSGVLTSVLWGLIYNEHVGVLNDFLMRFGIIDRAIAWTGNDKLVFTSVIIAELWRGIPFFAISLLASLQNIPENLYEAASIDGCGPIKRFFKVTLPMLKEQIVLTTLLRCVWEFNSVDLIYSLTGGGPAGKTTTLSIYIANQSIYSTNFGYGAAISVISFIILSVFSILYITLSKVGKESN